METLKWAAILSKPNYIPKHSKTPSKLHHRYQGADEGLLEGSNDGALHWTDAQGYNDEQNRQFVHRHDPFFSGERGRRFTHLIT